MRVQAGRLGPKERISYHSSTFRVPHLEKTQKESTLQTSFLCV
jgi:hypothetical protein